MDDRTAEAERPIIIKRKKVRKAAEHHGGAWKVAYADFVTAMMAFFLLMWLLNATTEDQRKGLADYFNPTIPISRISGGGSDALNGSSIFTEETYAQMGTGASRQQSMGGQGDKSEAAKAEKSKNIAENLQRMKDALGADGKTFSDHVLVKISPEGVVLELIDTEDEPLFQLGRHDPTPLLDQLLDEISSSFAAFQENIKIVGHTDGTRFRASSAHDNWDLSVSRASMARRLLVSKGLSDTRIVEVTGRADKDPLLPDDPFAAQNRRISVVILIG